MDVIKSSVALVSRKVLSPSSALSIGPRMDSVPMQNIRIAVDKPLPSLVLEWRSASASNRSSSLSAVPTTLPQPQTDDKQHRVDAVRHVFGDCTHAERGCGQAHGADHGLLPVLPQPFFERAADQTAAQNGAGIDDCP